MLYFLLKEAPRKGQSVCFIRCVIPFSWFMKGNVCNYIHIGIDICCITKSHLFPQFFCYNFDVTDCESVNYLNMDQLFLFYCSDFVISQLWQTNQSVIVCGSRFYLLPLVNNFSPFWQMAV